MMSERIIDLLGEVHSKPLLFNLVDEIISPDKVKNHINLGNGNLLGVDVHGTHTRSLGDLKQMQQETLRVLLQMGCKPILYLDSIRSDLPVDSSASERFQLAISEIASFHNHVGIPNLGGSLEFTESVTNATWISLLTCGLVKENDYKGINAPTEGDIVLQIGNLSDKAVPAAIVEKQLIDILVKLRDMELITSVVSISHGILPAIYLMLRKSQTGLYLDINALIEEDQPIETLVTDDLGGGLLVTTPVEKLNRVERIVSKIGLEYRVMGRLIEGEEVYLAQNEHFLARLPSGLPNGLHSSVNYKLVDIPNRTESNLFSPGMEHPLLKLLSSPNLSNKKVVYSQFDQFVLGNTVIEPGLDSGIVRLYKSLIAASSGANNYQISCDFKNGVILSFLSELRNVIARGAKIIGITITLGVPSLDDLNYTKLYFALKSAEEISEVWGVPIVGVHCSSILGTDFEITTGSLGLLESKKAIISPQISRKQSKIYLIGSEEGFLAGSAFHKIFGGDSGEMEYNLKEELNVSELIYSSRDLIESATDVGRGGLLASLARWVLYSDVGVEILYESDDLDFMYGEFGARYLVQISPENESKFLRIVAEHEIELTIFGRVINEKQYRLDPEKAWSLDFLRDIWNEQLGLYI